MGVDSHIINNLESQVSSLTKQIYFKDRQIRELTNELNDAKLREEKLMEEILDKDYSNLRHRPTHIEKDISCESTEDFLNPKLDIVSTMPLCKSEEMPVNSEFIFIYTEDIFVKHETPDCFLYLDDRNNCYRSLDRLVRLSYPINQIDIDKLHIVKVRVATDAEIEKICSENNL